MNDLSGADAERRRCCDPIPAPIPSILGPLFLFALALSVFILVVVRNAFPLVFLLVLSSFVASFFLWNICKYRRSGGNGGLLWFLDRMPVSDLLTAEDGQIVKVDGFALCGDRALESSYEKIERCIYSSTLLYEYRKFGSNLRNVNSLFFGWNLTYVERCIADFYITDTKSGTKALVKVGCDSKINALIKESLIVNTSDKSRELSSTLKKWLQERHLSSEARLLRLKEGYIKEGSFLTVMGVLSRKNGVLMIVPPPEPITTGCLLKLCLLPIDVDGLVLRLHDMHEPGLTSAHPDLDT